MYFVGFSGSGNGSKANLLLRTILLRVRLIGLSNNVLLNFKISFLDISLFY